MSKIGKIFKQLREEWKEKTYKHKLFAALGGIDVLFRFLTPILILIIWNHLFGLNSVGSYILLIVCLLASLFRAFRIGWTK